MKFRNLAAWERTLYILFFAQLMSAVGFSNIFPFLPLYVESLGTNTGISIEFWAGAVFSAQALTMMIASPFWGAIADRYGRKLMLQRAMFGGTLVLLLMGFVQSAEQLVLLRAIQGLITGTVAAANALVASVAPRERTGYAMGVVQVGLWSGVAIGPLMGGLLADAFGYANVFFLTASLLFLAGLLIHFGVEENFTPSPKAIGNKGIMGVFADWRHIFATEGVGMAYLLRFLSNLPRVIIIPVAPLFILSLMPGSERVNTMTGLVVGVAAAAGTATAIYLGRLGDNVGHRRVLLFATFAAGLLYLPQMFVVTAWQLLLLQALAGAAAGGVTPALSALLAKFTIKGEEGSVYGLDNAVVAGSRTIAPFIGSGIAIFISMRAAFAVTGSIYILVALIALWKLPADRKTAVSPAITPQSGD